MTASRRILALGLAQEATEVLQGLDFTLVDAETASPQAALVALDTVPQADIAALAGRQPGLPLVGLAGASDLPTRHAARLAGVALIASDAEEAAWLLSLVAGTNADRATVRILGLGADGDVLDRLGADGFPVSTASDMGALEAALARRPADVLVLCGPAAGSLARVLRQDPRFDSLAMLEVGDPGRPLPPQRVPGADVLVDDGLGAGELRLALVAALQRTRRIGRMRARDVRAGVIAEVHFLDRLDEELARATRAAATFTLALVEIDDLDGIDARAGLSAGNRAEGALAGLLRRHVRASDLVGHLGPGRFGLLLLGATADDSSVLVDTIRMAFSSLRPSADGGAVGATFSAGLADIRQGRTRALMMQAAEDALGEARGDGGDRVVAAEVRG